MATLTQSGIEKLFSGAPQYFARSEGHNTGAPHPSVAFPWDEALEIRDLRDHVQIEDSSWSSVTAWPHVTRDANRIAAARLKEKKRPHFYPRCRERPNMLSMEGLEKGTMGYQAALELAVADALQEEEKIHVEEDSSASRASIIYEKRQKMLSSKDGLRLLEESAILDQLIKNYDRYTFNRINKNISSTLYNELFLGILHPPTRVVDHDDPYSLTVQIQALLNVLATPHIWLDFSQVEWRIRLGQILWGSYHRDLTGLDIPEEEMDDDDWAKEERYWLLYQILLACELLIRLDAITEGEELGMESIRPAEIRRFERDATPTVRWSMHLARAWLENIQVVETEVDLAAPTPERNHLSGWLASLAGRMAPKHSPSHQPQIEKVTVYTIQGRHPQRQVDGLAHFARKLRWPEVETYAARILDNVGKASEATPINTPIDESPQNSEGKDSSYFGNARAEADVTTQPSRRRKITASLHPQGWLSKSYLSGLMLPGEGLQHFIMSTLLENDSDAMERLGPMANLCGGFIYGGKSFWSTACVVGRVLAAGKGSAECMGWISSDIVPQGHDDGWVDIIVDELPGQSQPRLLAPIDERNANHARQRTRRTLARTRGCGPRQRSKRNRLFSAMPTPCPCYQQTSSFLSKTLIGNHPPASTSRSNLSTFLLPSTRSILHQGKNTHRRPSLMPAACLKRILTRHPFRSRSPAQLGTLRNTPLPSRMMCISSRRIPVFHLHVSESSNHLRVQPFNKLT